MYEGEEHKRWKERRVWTEGSRKKERKEGIHERKEVAKAMTNGHNS